ncbi:MAG: hypothetical protein II311_02330 [Lachnospiraceae bacterium]|nr:hypothetical protein [Lachnospiraceae bacterium]
MRRALVSPLMLYHYDQDLFAGLTIPEQLDKDILVNNLLAETAEMEVIYPDPEIFKQMVEFWSASRIHTWERIANVLYEEYDPFINIKRDEVRTIESSGTNENAVSAWNEKTYQNRDKNTGSSIVRETFHVEGDSAITDAQDVARKEIALRTQSDLYRIVINDFKDRFCLLVY